MQDNLGLIFRMNTGFVPRRRKADFTKCKIFGTISCINRLQFYNLYILGQKQAVLRVQIQNKGEPNMKKTTPVQDAQERQIQELLAPYPDPMGRTDFRKA